MHRKVYFSPFVSFLCSALTPVCFIAFSINAVYADAGTGQSSIPGREKYKFPYDLSQKPIDTGVLDFLYNGIAGEPLQEPRVAAPSSYYLTPYNGPSFPDGNIPSEYLLRYEVIDEIHYYDKVTGAEVKAEDRKLNVEYTEVVEKNIKAVAFDFHFRKQDYESSLSPNDIPTFGDYETRKETITFNEVNYTLGKAKFTYTYSYNSPIEKTLSFDPSLAVEKRYNNKTGEVPSDIEGLFYGLENTDNVKYDDDVTGGGAIRLKGSYEQKSIHANFIDNSAVFHGGAIYNYADVQVGSIDGYFEGNHTSLEGGAIWNYDRITINTFNADFVENYVQGDNGNKERKGGALYLSNSSTIGTLTGNFIENHIEYTGPDDAEKAKSYGGALFIDSKSSIGELSGNFVGNYVSGNGFMYGGALYLHDGSKIGTLTGNFIGNHLSNSGSKASNGGAIYNEGSAITSITGNFIDNYITGGIDAKGGAIYNKSSVKDVPSMTLVGNFVGNYIKVERYANGGAVCNYDDSKIESITGDFVNNYIQVNGSAKAEESYGGAIFSAKSEIQAINGNFIGNYINTRGKAQGAALFNTNYTVITSISGDFISNHIKSNDNSAGAAVVNAGSSSIGTLTGNFIGNYVEQEGTGNGGQGIGATGGAIYNLNGTIKTLTGDFIGNYIEITGNTDAHGGAIYNGGDNKNYGDITGKIENIIGDFIGNYVDCSAFTGAADAITSNAYGGALTNHWHGQINHITGSFVRNSVRAHGSAMGGAIYNNRGSHIETIAGNFVRNYAETTYSDDVKESDDKGFATGGAILNYYAFDNGSHSNVPAEIGYIKGNFYSNYAVATETGWAQGGAISNHTGNSVINYVDGDFIGNYAKARSGRARGGAIFADDNSTIHSISGSFYNNYVESETGPARGGAIRNGGMIGEIRNSVFIGNYAVSGEVGAMETNGGVRATSAHGGAIYNEGTLTIAADNGVTLFQGNYVVQPKDSTAFDDFIDEYHKKYFINGDNIQVNEAIYAQKGSELTLKSQNNGHIIFEDIINGYNYKLITQGDEASMVTFNNDVVNATIEQNDVTLHIGVANHSGIDERYLRAEIKKYYEGAHSDVLRKSLLNAQSGLILLADNAITDYVIGTLVSNGKNYNEGEIVAPATLASPDADKSTTFAIDIWLKDENDKEPSIADMITTFAVWDKDAEAWHKNDSNGEDKSTGYVTLTSLTFNPNSKELAESATVVQILNLIVLDTNSPAKSLCATKCEYKKFFEETAKIPGGEAPLQLSNGLSVKYNENARMSSRDILCQELRLETTLTTNDSIYIRGWRDNLAAWAEIKKDDMFTDSKGDAYNPWEEGGKGEKIYEKVFIVENGIHNLTRDTYDRYRDGSEKDKTVKNPAVQGSKWTIEGTSKYGSLLYLNKHNLLTVVNSGQTARLQNFSLVGVLDDAITNRGNLTLDNMSLEPELKIRNEAGAGQGLTLNGKMDIYNTITSTGRGQMVIDNKSKVIDKNGNIHTVINLLGGQITNQDIMHQQSKEDDNVSTTTTILQTTDADGKATAAFKGFSNGTNSLTMEGGLFDLGNMGMNRLQLKSLSLSGGDIRVGFSAVDLRGKKMGGIDAGTASIIQKKAQPISGESNEPPSIKLENISVNNDATQKVTHVKFVDPGVADSVQESVSGAQVKGDIWYYDVYYNSNTSDRRYTTDPTLLGTFTFVCSGDPVPEVQAGAVTELAGSYVSMMKVYEYSFQHADRYAATIQAARDSMHYAMVIPAKGKEGVVSGNTCLPTTAGLHRGLWMNTYASTENMSLRHGPKVDAEMYGGIVGGDSDLREHRSGWASVYSLYGGYQGSKQKYEGVRIKQNGGAFGATATFYKKRFYTAVTAAVSTATGNTTTNRFGNEDFKVLMGGVAARAGYNIDLAKGRYILQPTLQMSYTCFKVHDFTNAAGVRMDADPTYALQFHPYVKIIRNSDCTWEPYATLGFVYDAMGKTKFKANGMELPGMSVKPYLEYSAGVQRTWRDRYTFYGQLTGRNGGRSGAEANIGLRCAF